MCLLCAPVSPAENACASTYPSHERIIGASYRRIVRSLTCLQRRTNCTHGFYHRSCAVSIKGRLNFVYKRGRKRRSPWLALLGGIAHATPTRGGACSANLALWSCCRARKPSCDFVRAPLERLRVLPLGAHHLEPQQRTGSTAVRRGNSWRLLSSGSSLSYGIDPGRFARSR